MMYWDGTVYRKDFELVQIWLQKAIDQGLEGAAELLDELRFEESKILLERAKKWEAEGCGYNAYDSLSQSAKLGNPIAKTLLALKLEAGEDCHKDVREAHRLLYKGEIDIKVDYEASMKWARRVPLWETKVPLRFCIHWESL